MSNNFNKRDVVDIAVTTIAAIVFSILLITVFALIIQMIDVPVNAIEPVNIAIKIVSVAAASLIGIRRKCNGLIKGFIIGLLYSGLTYLILALSGGSFTDVAMTIYDALTCTAAGLISGILAVNIGKQKPENQ